MKTMNNKVAKIHIYQQLNLKSKLSKQEKDRIMDTQSVLMVTKCERSVGEHVKR